MKIALILSLYLLCVQICGASHEQDIDPDFIICEFSRYRLKLEVATDVNGGLSKITVHYKEKSFSVPKEELESCGKDFLLSRLRLFTPVGSGSGKIGKSGMDFFGISIPFGNVTVNMVNGKEVHSFDIIRFEFVEGKLVARERAVSRGDDRNSWNLYSKEIGKKEQPNGDFTGPANPFEEQR
jgi:hypothetical protein